jgi:hypothetical protein
VLVSHSNQTKPANNSQAVYLVQGEQRWWNLVPVLQAPAREQREEDRFVESSITMSPLVAPVHILAVISLKLPAAPAQLCLPWGQRSLLVKAQQSHLGLRKPEFTSPPYHVLAVTLVKSYDYSALQLPPQKWKA